MANDAQGQLFLPAMKQGSLDHQDLPNWANRFLEWYCADELIDEIQGDHPKE